MKRIAPVATVVLSAVTGMVLLVAPVGAADAARIADDGWWWRAQTGVGGQPLPAPPDVEDDQLLVQAAVGDPTQSDGAAAIAAVSAELVDGHTAPVLTLAVADETGGEVAVLLACQAGSAWTGVHAGNWEAKPTADCDSRVEGERAADGSNWTFDLTNLQFNDKFNIVLVPGTDDSGATIPFSIVFEPPSAASIATTAPTDAASPPTTAASPPPAPAPPTDDAGFAVTDPAPAGDSSFAPGDAGSLPAVDPPAAPALDDADQGVTQTAPIINDASRPALPAISEESSRVAARTGGVLVLLLAAAGATMLFRGQTDLVRAAATADAPIEGGLGRFRRDREHEPPPVT